MLRAPAFRPTPLKRRGSQRIVLEKRELEGENVLCLRVCHVGRKAGQSGTRRGERVNQRLPFFVRRSDRAITVHRLAQADEHTHGQAGRGRLALELQHAIGELGALLETFFDEPRERLDGGFGIGALGAK